MMLRLRSIQKCCNIGLRQCSTTKRTSILPTIMSCCGAPDPNYINMEFLDDSLGDRFDINGKPSYEIGQGVYFKSLECAVLGEVKDAQLLLKWQIQKNLYGIIGSKYRNSVICLNEQGLLCVAKLDKDQNGIFKYNPSDIFCESYNELFEDIDAKTALWHMVDNHLLVTPHAINDNMDIYSPQTNHAILMIETYDVSDNNKPCRFGIQLSSITKGSSHAKYALPFKEYKFSCLEGETKYNNFYDYDYFESSPSSYDIPRTLALKLYNSYPMNFNYHEEDCKFWATRPTEIEKEARVIAIPSNVICGNLVSFLKRKAAKNANEICAQSEEDANGIVVDTVLYYCGDFGGDE